MSYFHDGQACPGAYNFPSHGQQSHLASLPPPNAPVYPFMDPTAQPQMYNRHSYGDIAHPSMGGGMDHPVWQAPQAPRLTAAAARAGRQALMGFATAGYAPTHGATPWYAQPLGVPQPYQQPRTHQQLEHQLLVQHHLAKVQERQNDAHLYQPAFGSSSAPYSKQQRPGQSRPHHHQQPHHQYQHPQHTFSAGSDANHNVYPDEQQRYHENWASAASHRGERVPDASQDWTGWQQQQQATHRGSVGYLPQPEHLYSRHPAQTSQRHSEDAGFHSSGAWGLPSHSRDSRAYGWNQTQHYPQQAYAEDRRPETDYRDAVASERSRNDYVDQRTHLTTSQERLHEYAEHHRDEQRHNYDQMRYSHSEAWRQHAQEAREHSEAARWPAQAEEVRDVHADVAGNVVDDREPEPAEEAADQASAPAPCSPGSLEKSALPIAAIGAQLIWNACAALFDPELLVEAHATADEAMEEDCDEAMSPAAASMPSSSSTPSLNTPDISPWASTVLDRSAAEPASSGAWNSFRSPFGPERLPHMRPQAHSFTFGSDNSSSQHDLHRMAVGAERARSALARDVSPTKRSREGSGDSGAAAGHSSGASTASSSEPGTPASLAHNSPALSSTVSAHSVETARSSMRVGLGMSLEGSRSESAIRTRSTSSSKISPKLPSSKWSGRIRDNVLAVLRLVSPDWRWSKNDHVLVSLSETLPTATVKASNSHSQGRSGGRDSVTSIVTSYANEPSPAFRRFVHQVLAQTLLSPPAFLLGILNALRLLVMSQLADGSTDPVVLELLAQPTSAAPFKLFTLGMMIANKHLDDNTFLNKTWTEVTGIPLAELNQTEAWFLKKCNYEVTVPEETWIGFLNRLQSWEEKRSSRGMHRDQDSSKRLLLVLDEALSHFDAIPAFQLDADAPHGVGRSEATSPMDMWAKSHHRNSPFGMIDDDEQHCHSAPAGAMRLPLHKSFAHDDESDAPSQRPSQSSRASLAMENPSATLLRSGSDFVSASGSFKDISPLSESEKSQNMSGPLMPSALLNGPRGLFHHGSMFGPLATSG